MWETLSIWILGEQQQTSAASLAKQSGKSFANSLPKTHLIVSST